MNTIQKSQNLFPDMFKPRTVAPKPFGGRRKQVFKTPGKSGNLRVFLISFMIYLLGIFPSLLFALPSDPTVQAGSVTIDASSANALTISQTTDKAIIDWRGFGILGNERVDFELPTASGVTLNRVTGNEPSAIFGKLTSNGNLFLINPNGILFGAGSQIDVNGLVATTSNINNRDFLQGNYNFDIPSNRNGIVVNRGTITASQGGLVALVAPGVQNDGIIQARLGRVSLASGNTFTLDLYGDQLVNLGVGSQVAQQVTGLDGEVLTSLISNRGKIFADGGTVLLDVNAARGVVDQVINMSGIIQARTAENINGTIVLRGGDAGEVDVLGTLDVSGLGAGETGGDLHVFGETIRLLDRALLNASGDAGGGTILVGGDYQGKGYFPTASEVFVGQEVSIFNDAISTGHGGKSIFWANRRMRFFGSVYARGGREWGDGGFIEVSGKEELFFGGWADTTATNGLTGTLLLDPEDIVIADGSGATASGATTFTIFEETLEALSGNTNIELLANNSVTLNDLSDNLLNLNISGSVTLTAVNGGITFGDTGDKIKAIRNINLIAGGALNIGSLESTDGGITLKGSNLVLGGTLSSVNSTTTLLSSNGGTIGMGTGAGTFSLSGSELQNITAANLVVGNSTTGNITVDGITAANSNNIAGTTTLNATGSGKSATFSGTASTFNKLAVNAGNAVAVNTAVTTDAGDLTLTGGTGGITGSGTTNLTSSQGIALNSNFSSTGDANLNAGTSITLASGISVSSGGTLALNSTTGTTANGAVTVSSASGLTLSDDFTSNGTATFDADSNADGTGSFVVASGKTVQTGNNSLSVTGADIALSGNLNSGTGTTTLLSSNGGTIGMGTGAGTFSLSGSELQNITAANLVVGNSTTGNITVDGITAANSNNIAGTTTLNATGSGKSATFSGTASTFNKLAVNAGNAVAVNTAVTTDAGDLTLTGGTGGITGSGTTNLTSSQGITLNSNFSSTGDANLNAGTSITLANGISVSSGGTLALNSTTGTTANGAVTVSSASGLTLNDDFTSNGTATFDADSNDDGTGSFAVASGKTVQTGNNSLSVTGADIALSGNLNSGTGTTTLLASNGGTIGLGAGAGTFSLSGSELQNITAGNLVVGNSTTGNITVDGVTAANSNNIAGTTTLNATGSGKSATFSGTASTFNKLAVNAQNSITVSENLTAEGQATFDADSDDDGTGGFTVASGKTVATGNNSLSVTGADITLDGNLNSGTGTTTLLTSDGGAIGLGAGAGTFSLTDSELGNITAGNLTIGDSTNGDITVDGVSVNLPGTTTLIASKTGSSVNFKNNSSSFGGLTVNSGSTVSDTGGGQLSVTGTSSFTGATGVSLTNTANSFGGAVSLVTGGNADLTTNSALTLASSTIGGNLIVTVAGGNGLIVSGDQTAGGTIALTASTDITLTGGLFSQSALASAIALTSTGGGIFDGDTTGALDISAPTGGLLVNSVTGFGTSQNPVETKLASVNITNTGAGEVNIFETDGLNIVNINHSGTGDITVSYFGALTGESNANAANGNETFINRNSAGVILPEFGKTLSEVSTEQTVGVARDLESSYFGTSPPSTTASTTVTEIFSGSNSGPFVTNVFDESFELIEVASKTKKTHKGLRGFSRFWGPSGTGNTEMVKRPSRKSVREEAQVRKKSLKKRKRLERKRRTKNQNARLERLGDTAALPKNQRKKKPDNWLSQTLETFFKN